MSKGEVSSSRAGSMVEEFITLKDAREAVNAEDTCELAGAEEASLALRT